MCVCVCVCVCMCVGVCVCMCMGVLILCSLFTKKKKSVTMEKCKTIITISKRGHL